MIRRWLVGAAVLLAVAGAAVAGLRLLPAGAPDGAGEVADPPPATAVVARTDLSTTRTVPGQLGFGPARTVKGGEGTVTWLPKAGAVITRGETVYRRDDRPVPLLYGATPLFRRLDTPNLAGRDVRVVVDNLRALGFRTGDQPSPGHVLRATPAPSGSPPPPQTVHKGDGVLTPSLVAAIKRWQAAYGVPPTGVVEPGDVVVERGKLRVGSLTAQPGAPANEPLMSVTGTAKVVTVQLDAGDTGSVRPGDAVRVTLPDGTSAKAKITGVGTVAESPENGGDSAGQARVAVTATLDEPSVADRLDAAPVEVAVLGETRKDVLAVPVGALLAVLEGGYAVQIAGGALVPVETGLFAGGQVEISGPGIEEGIAVVTTS
jgi:peptidoglycan hydrolase-like protein with peptidoglycan-binding domain